VVYVDDQIISRPSVVEMTMMPRDGEYRALMLPHDGWYRAMMILHYVLP
jgi:hypothetical protein